MATESLPVPRSGNFYKLEHIILHSPIKTCYCGIDLSTDCIVPAKNSENFVIVCPRVVKGDEEGKCGLFVMNDFKSACDCHPVACYHKVKNTKNQGRGFLSCGRFRPDSHKFGGNKGCGYFEWTDDIKLKREDPEAYKAKMAERKNKTKETYKGKQPKKQKK